jgi:hypothetical protein
MESLFSIIQPPSPLLCAMANSNDALHPPHLLFYRKKTSATVAFSRSNFPIFAVHLKKAAKMPISA